MKAERLNRRLATLEVHLGKEEHVPFSFQWIDDNGLPSGPLITRSVLKSRFGCLDEDQREHCKAA